MAFRPGRQRSSATPIITKGLVYPLKKQRASKLATHGFTSKSATHHMMHCRFRSIDENERKTEISRDFSVFFDFIFCRNSADAFRAFRTCSRIRTATLQGQASLPLQFKIHLLSRRCQIAHSRFEFFCFDLYFFGFICYNWTQPKSLYVST